MKKSSQTLFLTLLMMASTTPSYSRDKRDQDKNLGVFTRCKNAVTDTVQSVHQKIDNLQPWQKILAGAGLAGILYALASAGGSRHVYSGKDNIESSDQNTICENVYSGNDNIESSDQNTICENVYSGNDNIESSDQNTICENSYDPNTNQYDLPEFFECLLKPYSKSHGDRSNTNIILENLVMPSNVADTVTQNSTSSDQKSGSKSEFNSTVPGQNQALGNRDAYLKFLNLTNNNINTQPSADKSKFTPNDGDSVYSDMGLVPVVAIGTVATILALQMLACPFKAQEKDKDSTLKSFKIELDKNEESLTKLTKDVNVILDADNTGKIIGQKDLLSAQNSVKSLIGRLYTESRAFFSSIKEYLLILKGKKSIEELTKEHITYTTDEDMLIKVLLEIMEKDQDPHLKDSKIWFGLLKDNENKLNEKFYELQFRRDLINILDNKTFDLDSLSREIRGLMDDKLFNRLNEENFDAKGLFVKNVLNYAKQNNMNAPEHPNYWSTLFSDIIFPALDKDFIIKYRVNSRLEQSNVDQFISNYSSKLNNEQMEKIKRIFDLVSESNEDSISTTVKEVMESFTEDQKQTKLEFVKQLGVNFKFTAKEPAQPTEANIQLLRDPEAQGNSGSPIQQQVDNIQKQLKIINNQYDNVRLIPKADLADIMSKYNHLKNDKKRAYENIQAELKTHFDNEHKTRNVYIDTLSFNKVRELLDFMSTEDDPKRHYFYNVYGKMYDIDEILNTLMLKISESRFYNEELCLIIKNTYPIEEIKAKFKDYMIQELNTMYSHITNPVGLDRLKDKLLKNPIEKWHTIDFTVSTFHGNEKKKSVPQYMNTLIKKIIKCDFSDFSNDIDVEYSFADNDKVKAFKFGEFFNNYTGLNDKLKENIIKLEDYVVKVVEREKKDAFQSIDQSQFYPLLKNIMDSFTEDEIIKGIKLAFVEKMGINFKFTAKAPAQPKKVIPDNQIIQADTQQDNQGNQLLGDPEAQRNSQSITQREMDALQESYNELENQFNNTENQYKKFRFIPKEKANSLLDTYNALGNENNIKYQNINKQLNNHFIDEYQDKFKDKYKTSRNILGITFDDIKTRLSHMETIGDSKFKYFNDIYHMFYDIVNVRDRLLLKISEYRLYSNLVSAIIGKDYTIEDITTKFKDPMIQELHIVGSFDLDRLKDKLLKNPIEEWNTIAFTILTIKGNEKRKLVPEYMNKLIEKIIKCDFSDFSNDVEVGYYFADNDKVKAFKFGEFFNNYPGLNPEVKRNIIKLQDSVVKAVEQEKKESCQSIDQSQFYPLLKNIMNSFTEDEIRKGIKLAFVEKMGINFKFTEKAPA